MPPSRTTHGTACVLLLHQKLESTIAPAACGHLEHAGLIAICIDDSPDTQALQERSVRDAKDRLSPGGTLLLYTGSPIVGGVDARVEPHGIEPLRILALPERIRVREDVAAM